MEKMDAEMRPTPYAGVGSRKTPDDVLRWMRRAAMALAGRGYLLRSGAAQGADSAFEQGADDVGGPKEVFTAQGEIPDWAFATVAEYHPAPERLRSFPRRLMARNAMQVLGERGDLPAAFVLCWTPGGRGEGGTGQAIRIAQAHAIPVFDMGRPEVLERVISRVRVLESER